MDWPGIIIGIALIALGIATWSLDKELNRLRRDVMHLNKQLDDLQHRMKGQLPSAGEWEED